jgi:hypothetical protein
MPELPEVLKNVVAIIVLALVASGLTLVAHPPQVASSTATSTIPIAIDATTTEPIATTTLSVATTTPEVPKKVATTTPPKKPTNPIVSIETTPKVEDLHITLTDAIDSINNLANATSSPVNDRVRSALVNILCATRGVGPFESISASGVIIDPRGVVLTNAHVAQFFLLRNYPTPNFVQCIIRTGSPATPAYTAELLFISPSWIAANAQKLSQTNPTGNGEHDYALVRITGAYNSSVTLPSQFPFVLTAVNAPPEGTDVLEAGYAAGFLGGSSILNNLYASSAFSKVGQIYTYGSNEEDLFSVGGSIVAQHGSSGGPVTTTDGTLVGLLVTSTDAVDTAGRDLRALATSYIIKDFENDRGKSLESVLSGNLADEAAIFNQVYAPLLTQKLITALQNPAP